MSSTFPLSYLLAQSTLPLLVHLAPSSSHPPPLLYPPTHQPTMSQTPQSSLQYANDIAKSDPSKAEALYNDIIQTKSDDEDVLRDQEDALLKLGELYRDQQSVLTNLVLVLDII